MCMYKLQDNITQDQAKHTDTHTPAHIINECLIKKQSKVMNWKKGGMNQI